jgi:hypothetical protein
MARDSRFWATVVGDSKVIGMFSMLSWGFWKTKVSEEDFGNVVGVQMI